MIPIVNQNLRQLQALCKENQVANLYLFGSATGEAFNVVASDLDLAVEFASGVAPEEVARLFFSLQESLQKLFERKVDLVSYSYIKNPVFREEVERTKISLYAA